jgi:iron complex outermembrane receptor protein
MGIVLLLLSISPLFAQNTVTGRVTDKEQQPLQGVSVIIKGQTTGTQTTENGNYQLTVERGKTLVFSMVGYRTTEVTVSQAVHNVVLLTDESLQEEVVVTALGVKRAPRELGYSVSTIQAEELTKTGSPNIAGALYGKAPGVRISTSPGGATSGANINIRGINSITGHSRPLIIIDGVPMRNNDFNNSDYWNDQRSRGNGLEDLNPEDIASLSILKGASAAALYGSEALNGVVMITTKSGRVRKGIGLDFNATYTKDEIAYLPRFQEERGPGAPKWVADGGQADDGFFWYDLNNDGVNETRGAYNGTLNFGPSFDGQPYLAWDGQIRPYSAQNAYKNFFNNPQSTIINAAMLYGTENVKVRFSVTRQDNEMTTIGSYNKKNILNLNTSFKLAKNFTTDVIVNFINQRTHNRPFMTDRLINNFAGMISTFDNPDWYINKYQTSLGYKYVTANNQSLTPAENIRYNGYRVDVLDYFWNSMANKSDEYSNRLIGSFTNTWEVVKGLTLRSRFSADVTSLDIEDKRPNELPLQFGNTGGFDFTSNAYNIYYTDLLLSYHYPVSEDVTISAMAGYTATKNETKNQKSLTNGGLSVRNWFDISSSVNQATTTLKRIYTLRDAAFGTLSFNYKDFWFLEGTIRRERVSTMHPDNNVLLYPSVNTGVVFSDFINFPTFISYAKLRGSFGIVGKYPEPYQSASSYTQNTLGDQGNGTAVLYTTIPNAEFYNERIKPENKHEVELGLELKFMNDRMGFDATYYNGRVVNQILYYSLPISMGASSILSNLGSLRNTGWEFSLNYSAINTPDFSWYTAINLAMNKNKIEELPGQITQLLHRDYDGAAAQLVSKIGEPIGDIMVHPIARNDKGELLVQDNGLYQLDGTNWIKAGNYMPKGIGGFINNFTFKNFSLDVLIDYRWGGHVMPTGINWMISRGLLEESLNHSTTERGGISYYRDANGKGVQWSGSAGPNGETVYHDGMLVEGVTSNGQNNQNVISQAFYYNNTYNWGGPQYSSSRYELYIKENNYIKMRELSLGYRIPSAIASKLGANNLHLSVFARNPFFIYRSIKDLDPEQMTGGSYWVNNVSNAGVGPATRTYGIMLRASF